MALTPSGWIPSLGPLAGSQVPERSWRGAAAGAVFWLAAPDFSLATVACCGLPPAGAKDEKSRAGAKIVIKIHKRFRISKTSPANYVGLTSRSPGALAQIA